jgi:phosphoglycolate phosphatase
VYEVGVSPGRSRSGRPTVLLFDVDGTLIYAGGAGRRAITRVFAERYGHPRLFDEVRFHGMTDRAIVREALGRAGLHCDERTIDDLCAAYLVALADEVPRSTGFTIHPGVPELLDWLSHEDGVAVGLGTGNLRQGARIKLEHARLMHHFTFGGYGCDDEDRPSLIGLGAERGASRLGVPLAQCRIVVIGDTPRDIAAAQAVGAAAVVVETGGFGAADLLAAGAQHAFRTLADEGVRAAILA